MSSATSIKQGIGTPDSSANQLTAEAPATSADAGFRPWHFFVLASLMAATAAVVMSRQTSPGHLILISLTIAAAGLAAAGFYRMLAPLASDDLLAYSEPLTARKRASLEREKMLTLRSIKELEFDRAMGKVSGKDFDEMVVRLRTRAITLMKELDDGRSGYRTEIQRELEARLAARAEASASPAAAICQACGTGNDADASFCKRCGARMGLEPTEGR